jgi:hypothetical protein
MATILAEKRSGCNCQKLQRSFSLVGSKSETPPALAVWSFNFDLQSSSKKNEDTTRFSGVEFQLQP